MAFFESKKAAAVLKHAILNQYLMPFAAKTGSTSVGGRVAFVDGYAGEGRYENGADGSPTLALYHAKKLIPMRRKLECIFVERDAPAYEKLSRMMKAEAGEVPVHTIHGDVEDHLDEILRMVEGVPVLLFLDPFGLMFPFQKVATIWNRPHGYGTAGTEVLINFNAGALRRIAGHLTSPNANAATLSRLDEACGGDWWREVWLAHDDKDAAEEAVVAGYASRLAQASGGSGYWMTDVRNKPQNKPIYHLVFLTRHRDGMAVFGEALSLGLKEWRRAVAEADYDEGMLFTPDEIIKHDESVLDGRWIQDIEGNLRRLLAEGKGFVIQDRYKEVFGATVGLARTTHLRAAWKTLHKEGVTPIDSTGKKLIEKRIVPA
jgi:three-Cys-motif partner protein